MTIHVVGTTYHVDGQRIASAAAAANAAVKTGETVFYVRRCDNAPDEAIASVVIALKALVPPVQRITFIPGPDPQCPRS